ncbi:M23 family metallopeptidase [Alkalihalobacterium bogoriense]|uniref:M23 family metallopeptidase n=1 Tax=Alkalihalobacterium bogoriense TaxID=246272 RepID=UPI00047E4E8D|nr:M23 family metallopeptidase [Alkalihalobacterium bogoriense]
MREEEKNQSSNQSRETQSFNVQRFLRKRWIVPAVYLGAAAVVLSVFFMLQGGNDTALPSDDFNEQGQPSPGMTDFEDAVPVVGTSETMTMPIAEGEEVEIIGNFFDYDASPEEQQAALVYYDNTYRPNTGIDLAKENGESFDVTAALSGTVIKAEKDELLGYVVEIQHEEGVVTHYQSLDSIKVEEGQSISQGEILGQAGRSLYNSDAGIHVHFEVRHNGQAVNPVDYMDKTVDSIIGDMPEEDEPKEEEPKEDKPKDDEKEEDGSEVEER